MTNKQSILFITTSSLASNPRLVKEVECLKKAHSCYVLCFKHHDWSWSLSEAIKEQNEDVQFIEIDRQRQVLETVKSKIWHKLALGLNSIFQNNYKISALASNDKALQLWWRVKKMRSQYQFDRVIAHNLGAFYAAVKLSKHQDIILQLDIEDFYPGEALYHNKTYEEANRYRIMQYSFERADAITYASKGIQQECMKAFETVPNVKHETLLNAFEKSDFLKPIASDTTSVKCVWFSQNIGPNRGLEQVFEAARLHPDIEFHLVGHQNASYLETIEMSKKITCHEVMSQKKLHHFLNTMDIGLALENSNADFNRDICLTNKFLAYAQAGLYILATDTYGQREFLKDLNYEAGTIIEQNLTTALNGLEMSVLSSARKLERWENAKTFSWEKESMKLLNLMA